VFLQGILKVGIVFELVVPGVRLVIEEEYVVAAVIASSEIGWERWNVCPP